MRPEVNRKSSARAPGVSIPEINRKRSAQAPGISLHPRYQSEERHCLWPPVSDQAYFSRSRPLMCAVAPRPIGREEAPGLLVSSSPVSIGRKAPPLASSERSDLDLAHCCLLLSRDQSSEEKHLGFWYHPRYKSEEKRSFWYSIPEINRKKAVCGLPTRPGHNAFGRRDQVMAGYLITPVLGFWTCRDLHWEFLRLWTSFELPSSWSNLPCYGVNLNRNILDFMK
jgi:hypothetical protein